MSGYRALVEQPQRDCSINNDRNGHNQGDYRKQPAQRVGNALISSQIDYECDNDKKYQENERQARGLRRHRNRSRGRTFRLFLGVVRFIFRRRMAFSGFCL